MPMKRVSIERFQKVMAKWDCATERELAREIAKQCNHQGMGTTAVEIGISQSLLSYWLTQWGYRLKYVRVYEGRFGDLDRRRVNEARHLG